MLRLLVVVILSVVVQILSQPQPAPKNPCCEEVPILGPENLNFTYWDLVVNALVKENATINGVMLNSFNYTGLIGNSNYNNFKCQVENTVAIQNFTETEWKAFWINVYNYLAIRVIFENNCATDLFGGCRPLSSIKEIGEQQPSLFDVIWQIPTLLINNYNGGAMLALNDIEDGCLRSPPPPFIEDVRIHGCIVCASVSCPDLRNTAYTVDDLDNEMSDNVQKWLANPAKGSSVSGNTITLSAIFNWFADDFNNVTGKGSSSNMTSFLTMYAPTAVGNALRGSHTLQYFTYNWNLNGYINGLCKVDRPCFPWWALLCLILGVLVVVVVSVLCVRRRRNNYSPLN